MSKMLSYNDFIGKCAPDSVVAIKTYLLFMRRICNFEFKVLPEYQPVVIENNKTIADVTHNDYELIRFIYLFLLCTL